MIPATPLARQNSGNNLASHDARRAPARAWVASILALATLGVGAVDVLIGTDLTVTPFYVPLVVMAAWQLEIVGGAAVATACAAVGILADHLLSEPSFQLTMAHELRGVPWWNGLARWSVYLVVAWTVARLRRAIEEREQTLVRLESALAEVRTLEGLLPICAWCKHIRDEEHGGSWVAIEQYVAQRTEAEFTHGICPDCARSLARDRARTRA